MPNVPPSLRQSDPLLSGEAKSAELAEHTGGTGAKTRTHARLARTEPKTAWVGGKFDAVDSH